MKVLFNLLHAGGLAHLNPLITLNSQCQKLGIETAFLIPKFRHDFLRQYGLNVLDIDHQSAQNMGFRTELQAYGSYSPDVVLDDASFTTYFAASAAKIPRVTIQRTGIFPFDTYKNSQHKHSMGDIDLSEIPDVSYLGIKQPETFEDFFKADAKIIPGIKSLEILPEAIADDDSYFYSGPLIIEDFSADKGREDINFTNVSERSEDIENYKNFSELESFFETNNAHKFIYITYGTIAVGDVPETFTECIKYLLDEGFAVVSSVPVEGLKQSQNELFYFSRYLPMHYVCERVDLMIHHCGSGTYQYPIIHQVPTITVGTSCFDREEVAYRIEDFGAGRHLSNPREDKDFTGKFKALIDLYFNDKEFISSQKKKLSELHQEVIETENNFDLTEVLKYAISKQ